MAMPKDEAKRRRDELRDAGFCINGEHHGNATNGSRCAWCAVVHAVGSTVARGRASRDPKHPQPPKRPR